MAGRPRKLGIEACPKCGNLGRRQPKPVRNRPGSRYVNRSYFRHNDRRIKECYIDNLTRPKPKEKTLMELIGDTNSRLAHDITKIIERIKTFPLNRTELEWLFVSLKWHERNVARPMCIMWDILNGKLRVPPGVFDKIFDDFMQNMLSEKNVLGAGYEYLYEKYDRPKRLERNRKRNKLLSEWNGRKTTDYTGIAEPVPV